MFRRSLQLASRYPSADLSRRAAILYFSGFAVITLFAFYTNRPCLFFDWDGANWAVLMDYFPNFANPLSIAMVDPTQGMFDAFMQGYRGLLPQNVLFAVFGKPEFHKVITHAFYALTLAFSVFLLGRAGGFNRGTSLTAGVLLCALTLPMFKDDGVLEVVGNLNPNYTYVIALATAVTAIVWQIDSSSFRRTALLTAVAIVLALAVAWSFIFYFIYFTVIVAMMGLASLFATGDRSTSFARLAALVCVAAVVLAAGFPNYLYDLGYNMAFRVFESELSVQLSLPLLAQSPHFYWILLAGVVGAFGLLPSTQDRRVRSFALGHIALVAMYVVYTAILLFSARPDTGPTLPRLVPFISAVGVILATVLLIAAIALAFWVAGFVLKRVAFWNDPTREPGPLGMENQRQQVSPRTFVTAVHATLVIVLGGTAMLAAVKNPGVAQKRCSRPYFSPLERNAIIDYLEPKVALTIGKPFRGSVATFTGPRSPSNPVWVDNVTSDYYLWHNSGNDLRFIGLWQYHIPTLAQVSISITPQYFLTLAEFLTKPGDRQVRAIMSLTHPNEKMMALWGVRFVIADHPLAFGLQRLEMPVKLTDPPKYRSPIRVTELARANLGDYSPTEVIVAKDATDSLARMREQNFDGIRQVVVDRAMPGAFVQARNVSMTLADGGFRLNAESEGQSILVLPVQYSHCWVATSTDGITLFRANLMQLGVRFSGHLSVQMQYRFGPFWNSRCRREDGKDAERMNMAGARSRT